MSSPFSARCIAKGRKLIVVLDRFNVHRKAVRLLKESGAKWLSVDWLPAYAPDLNVKLV